MSAEPRPGDQQSSLLSGLRFLLTAVLPNGTVS